MCSVMLHTKFEVLRFNSFGLILILMSGMRFDSDSVKFLLLPGDFHGFLLLPSRLNWLSDTTYQIAGL